MKASTAFEPLHSNELVSLCTSTDVTSFELFDEAELRQRAAQQLVSTLGVVEDIGAATDEELAGCFFAIHLLLKDATALYSAARVAVRAESEHQQRRSKRNGSE